MARKIEQPVTVERRDGETVTTHPAFGQIAVNRTTGRVSLYGSDFNHNHYMTIRIKRSQQMRSLARDWSFGREEIIEVALSEAQWASFVSSPNIGDGTPCTIQRDATYPGFSVPGLPDPASTVATFAADVNKYCAAADAALTQLSKDINDAAGSLTKPKRAQLLNAVERARRQLNDSVPFVAKAFNEHAEKTVEKAKNEIHGYMTGVLMRAGLTALKDDLPLQLQIEDKSDE